MEAIIFSILMTAAAFVLSYFITLLIIAFCRKDENVIKTDSKVKTNSDVKLYRDFNTIEEKVIEALRRLNLEIENNRDDFESRGISMPNEEAIKLFTKFLEDYFIFRSNEFEAFPSVDDGVYIRVDNIYTDCSLRITICNDGVIIYSPDFENTGIIYDCTINDLVETVNDFLNKRINGSI